MTIHITTSFVRYDNLFLLLKRSIHSRSFPGVWSAISGIIEGDEAPLERAKTEIREETGIVRINLVRRADPITVHSDAQSWKIWPFLFDSVMDTVQLNRENSEFLWVDIDQIKDMETVPGLGRVLGCLL